MLIKIGQYRKLYIKTYLHAFCLKLHEASSQQTDRQDMACYRYTVVTFHPEYG
jgi:hypothetical protein